MVLRNRDFAVCSPGCGFFSVLGATAKPRNGKAGEGISIMLNLYGETECPLVFWHSVSLSYNSWLLASAVLPFIVVK